MEQRPLIHKGLHHARPAAAELEELRALAEAELETLVRSKPRGRPPGREYVAVVARFTPAQLGELDQWAAKRKLSRAAALREAVDGLLVEKR